MNYFELKLASKTENVLLARAATTAFLVSINPKLSVINEIKTIVSEAVTNSIVHGYKFDETKEVHLKLTQFGDELFIEIEDKGVGIDNIEQALTPMFTTSEHDERSGLGFTIMDVFSDKFEVISSIGKGTVIKCMKYLKHEGDELF